MEAWNQWTEGKPGRFVLRRPTALRHTLSWKEMKVVMSRFMCILDALELALPEHQETAKEAKSVLRRLQKRWAIVTKCLKQLHFQPCEKFSNPVTQQPSIIKLKVTNLHAG